MNQIADLIFAVWINSQEIVMAIDISKRPDRPARKFYIPQKRKGGITSDLLKLIAIVAMVIDHIAWAFVPFGSIAGQLMHIIGRVTAPIMCFMIAEGYHKTHNVKKYAQRLGIFAIISHFAYMYYETGHFIFYRIDGHLMFNFNMETSIMFPLFLGLIALIVRDSPKYEAPVKNMIVLVICLVAIIGDWGATAVIWILLFSSFSYSRKEQMKYFCIVAAVMILLDIVLNISNGVWYNDLYQLGVFLAVPLLMKYNGVRKGGKGYKWFFYVFYPAHLLVIAIIRYSIVTT